MTLKRYAQLGTVAVLLVLALSYWSGCWRRWRQTNPPPPPIPERIDPGETVDAPDTPTVPVSIETRIAELTPDQVGAWLKKYGLTATRVTVPAAVAQQTPTPGGFVPGSVTAAQPDAVVEYPIRLAETRFCQQPDADGDCPQTVPQIDVTAFQSCPGCEVEQRGVWRELEPEPCPEAKAFAAPGRFRTFVGVGGIGGSVEDDQGGRVSFAEPALLLGGTFEGVRVGPVTLGGMGLAGVSQGGDVAGSVGIGISF